MRVEQELLILGLLKDKPRHGYEIKKQIREVVSTFAVLEVQSIYYSLSLLEKKGFVKRVATSRRRGLEKFTYGLTLKGEERFKYLLTKGLLDVERPNFTFDLALYFLPYLPLDVALHRLKGRARLLSKVEAALRRLAEKLEVKSSYHLKSIVDHNLELLEAEKQFLSHVGQEISRQKISLPEWPHSS